MKQLTIKKTALVIALSAALVACEQSGDKKESTDGAQQAVEFKGEYDKAAYAIGVNFSKQMGQNFESLKSMVLKLIHRLLLKASKMASPAMLN